MQTTPGIRGGKSNPNCRGHWAENSEDRPLDQPGAENSDCNRTWRRTRGSQTAAKLWLLPRKRGREEESGGEKFEGRRLRWVFQI